MVSNSSVPPYRHLLIHIVCLYSVQLYTLTHSLSHLWYTHKRYVSTIKITTKCKSSQVSVLCFSVNWAKTNEKCFVMDNLPMQNYISTRCVDFEHNRVSNHSVALSNLRMSHFGYEKNFRFSREIPAQQCTTARKCREYFFFSSIIYNDDATCLWSSCMVVER